MNAFYVRVCFGFNFAQEMIEKQISPFDEFKKHFPRSAKCDFILNRFTFGVLSLQASSADECREIINKAWEESFPGREKDITVFVADKRENDDTSELMKTIYRLFYGVDEYIKLVTELAGAIPFLKERGALGALRMQNYLFAIDSGCGFTRLISSFGDYLHRMKIYGDSESKRTKYSEYKIGKDSDNGCTSVDDFINDLPSNPDEITTSMVGVDISYFLEGSKYDELRDFARRLYRKQPNQVFAFRIPFLEKKAMDEVAGIMSDMMLLRVIQIPPLHDAVLLEFMWDEMKRLGYEPNNSISELFFKKVRQEKQDGRFYGFKTAEKIVHEMVLLKARYDSQQKEAGKKPDPEIVRPEDIGGLVTGKDKKKNGFDELGELIGMETIADKVREIVAQVKISIKNEKLDRPCIHMRFVGAPGTGKTTVARIIGQIFREEGILRKGAFMEYSARSLCAEYVGQTAVRTAAICRDAYGSVLFIDEAYALYDGTAQTNDYGREALTTLISEMENHRDDMLVIMAGYTDDMETLMKGNAGLRSRMPYMISFPNYTRKQLYEIFMLMVRKHFEYDPELVTEARAYFDSLSDEYLNSREFANARFVRNLYERTWSKAALRASMEGLGTISLTRQDFLAASGEKEFGEKLDKEKRIGF